MRTILRRLLPCVLCAGLVMGIARADAPSTAPVLAYSTYLRDNFTPNSIATDASGNIYVAGNLLIDAAARQTTVLVMKLNSQGMQDLYTRYLGGSVYETANAIAVDSAGNAYLVGQTASPDFPVVAGGNLGAPPTSATDLRAFITKLDPTGNIVFSDLLGGTAVSNAQAVAVTPSGQAVITGTSRSAGFPTTAGAYTASTSANHPFLLKLDATGTKAVFSATGIGGNAVTLDSSGNIFVAGNTGFFPRPGGPAQGQPDYPLTPGVYQTSFPEGNTCLFPCQIVWAITGQYVTKVDPSGSKLIYSTSLSGIRNTFNSGLAVDEAGNAYVTGYAEAGYPYTMTPPAIPPLPSLATNFATLPFLSKLDAAGQSLLFSEPVGGNGVQLDASARVYVGGRIGYIAGYASSFAVTASLPALAGVPRACLPNQTLSANEAYVSQADAASGGVLGTRFITGSNILPSAVALAGSKLWIAAATGGTDVPYTPNILIPDFVAPYYGEFLGGGAYLGAVDFSQTASPTGTPQIGCLLDGGSLAPVGPVSRYQVLAMFGTGLGPAVGVNASDNSTVSLGGTSVTVGGIPAIMLYASATQVNVVVPLVDYHQYSATIQITVNGLSSEARLLPIDYANPSLFVNASATFQDPNNQGVNAIPDFVPLALNPDGAINSASNPAPKGATVSIFINGLAPNPQVNSSPVELTASNGWTVERTEMISPFVLRVDVQAPELSLGTPLLCVNCGCTLTLCNASLVLSTAGGLTVAPASGAKVWFKEQ